MANIQNVLTYHERMRRLVVWLRHLGGPGLILLGILDNSAVPLPGSQDVLLIILAAESKNWWLYYASMATLGALVGGYITYRLAVREGKALLGRRMSSRRVVQIENTFAKWGFGAVMVPALLPPPLPMFPFLIAAGALEYPRGKFLTALAIGRGIRYTVFAYLAARYGRLIIAMILRYHNPILIAGILTAVALALYILLRARHGRQPTHSHQT